MKKHFRPSYLGSTWCPTFSWLCHVKQCQLIKMHSLAYYLWSWHFLVCQTPWKVYMFSDSVYLDGFHSWYVDRDAIACSEDQWATLLHGNIMEGEVSYSINLGLFSVGISELQWCNQLVHGTYTVLGARKHL